MDKNNFIDVIHAYSNSSEQDAQEILLLKHDYPYSQLLHALSARVTKDHGFSNQQYELQLAAVYSCDRSVLKEIMTAEVGTQPLEIRKTQIAASYKALPVEPLTSDQLAEEVIHDLQRLHELKNNFEALFFSDIVEESTVSIEGEKGTTVPDGTDEEDDDTVVSSKKIKSGLSKKERIIALAKEADERAAEAKAREKEDSETTSIPLKKKENTIEGLIDEIASTKKEIDPETDKQKLQIEIIDQFIKAQPSIANSKDKPLPAPAGDLSTIKSGEFGNNIVSETLVDILLKQGKKEKAVEVLKKLIWKFPQKKAYFAAQIEELKN